MDLVRQFSLPLLLLVAICPVSARPEVEVLLDVKNALDPHHMVLLSWQAGGQPCSGAFEGVLCDAAGRVTNISLQGRSLSGFIPDALAELTALTSVFLHFNELRGAIPPSLSTLTSLTDLYLNWNQFSGAIPPQLAQLPSLQVLELCCNKLEGGIPAELGALSYLETLAVNANNLNGTMPAALGNLTMLTRLDVSNNSLTGTIPETMANLSNLVFVDVSHNLLSGPIPAGWSGLGKGFRYGNNSGLCGANMSAPCRPSTSISGVVASPKMAPAESSTRRILNITTGIVFAIGGSAFFILAFICLRRRRAKLKFESSIGLKKAVVKKEGVEMVKSTKVGSGGGCDDHEKVEEISGSGSGKTSLHSGGGSFRGGSTPEFSILGKSRVMSERSSSTSVTVVSRSGLPSPAEWPSSWIHLGELETATNYFSEKNLLRRNAYTAVYKGTLRDGTVVAVKAIYNTRFAFGEAQEFQIAIEALMQVKHENLVKFLGFCCSKGGSECFLVYTFIPEGSLEHHLHGQKNNISMNWKQRVNIIRGIAKGLAHLHEGLTEPLTVVHQNLWAGNILIDKQGNAMLTDYGLSDIVAEEVMYSTHKTLAALGYLAPEYAYTGLLTEDSDIYAFGALVLELLTGHRPVSFTPTTRTLVSTAATVKPLLELGKVREFVDPKLGSRFSLAGAAGLAHIAMQCMADDPGARPDMVDVVRRLHAFESWSDMAIDSFLCSPGGESNLYSHSFAPEDMHHQCR